MGVCTLGREKTGTLLRPGPVRIKPFYYTTAGGSFLFASEIKALLAHPETGNKPDDKMLCTYLAWGVQDHCSHTMFDGILQLVPAHALVVTRDGIQSPYQYWDVKVNPED